MKLRRWVRVGTWLLVAGIAAGSMGPLVAQQGGARVRAQTQSRQNMEAQLRRAFGERIRLDLGLSEEQFSRVQSSLQVFQEERRELARRERATRLRIQAVLEAGEREDSEAAGLLDEMVSLREEELSLFKREMEALAEDLTPEQRLRFIVFRDRLNQRIQGVRGREGFGGPPGGMPPGGEAGGVR